MVKGSCHPCLLYFHKFLGIFLKWKLGGICDTCPQTIITLLLGEDWVYYGVPLRITDGGKTDSSPYLCSSTALETSSAQENPNGRSSLLLFVLRPGRALIFTDGHYFTTGQFVFLCLREVTDPTVELIKVVCTHFRIIFICQCTRDLCIKFQNLYLNNSCHKMIYATLLK